MICIKNKMNCPYYIYSKMNKETRIVSDLFVFKQFKQVLIMYSPSATFLSDDDSPHQNYSLCPQTFFGDALISYNNYSTSNIQFQN